MDEAFVIRAATLKDLDWLYGISASIGIGFTSIPNNKEFLQKRLMKVEQSFQETNALEDRLYLFVLESLEHGLIGICGIDVNIGYKESFYNYQVAHVTQICEILDKSINHTILTLVNNFQEASELISFWLHPKYRGQSIGKALSYCRFLFMAQFPQLIGDDIIAELRGYVDANNISPFWEAVGKKFFAMEFRDADELTYVMGKQFIADLVSREPIYVDLLPVAAQKAVGIEHIETSPARHILESQGFKYSHHVDIFDAGPLLLARRDEIKAVTYSRVGVITELKEIHNGEALLYNNKLEARFTVASIKELATGNVAISTETAQILHLNVGDNIRYYFL